MTKQSKSADTLEQGITNMIETMAEDFASWDGDPVKYRDDIEVTTGRKYAKVIHQRSVTAFVVLTDTDKKFLRGDILKPAGYATPARNSARGNVLRGGYPINWTGPLYLN